jgi:hypothetical protein
LLLCAITSANPEILAAHNAYRNEVGVVPLTYNTTLAAGAQTWATYEASTGIPQHSSSSYGENIAWTEANQVSWTDVVNSWASEKTYFIYGPFGDGSSTTGHWYDIGHYTQIVWSTTMQCGCGKATNVTQNVEYFVCQYYPHGNIWGYYPYPVWDNVGVYRQSDHTFYLRNGGDAWTSVTVRDWGISTDLPVTGDWNGDGITDVGVYRQSDHTFYLRNGGDAWTSVTVRDWGISTDLPVTGNW